MKFCTPCRHPNHWFVNQYKFLVALFVIVALSGYGSFAVAHSSSKTDSEDSTMEGHGHHGHGSGDEVGSGDPSLTLGSTVYQHMCGFCHGKDGNGGGKATSYLYPWARDFRKGVFKHRSTPSGSLPLDKDIFETISRGVPGTAMPAWGKALTDEETWSVIKYIKTFSKRFEEEQPRSPIIVGKVPPTTPESVAKGKALYEEMRCQRCHGTDLKGDGPIADNLYDIWDHRLFVYDLTNPNTYKWGFDKKQVYMTLTTGIDGTPMKSFSHLTDEERWRLADYIISNIKMEQLQSAEYETDIYSKIIDVEPDLEPDSEFWQEIPSQDVHLIPLNARRNPVNRIQFQSVIYEGDFFVRLQWDDPTPNKSSSRHQDFKDAVAVEFALGDVLLHEHGHNEPFFGMGNRGKVVNIWQWRADWQQEIETKKQLEYATDGMQDHDVLIFGGEVNPVEALNPFRENPVEELNAEGFGTLTPQPLTKQNVQGNGVWKDGKWTVVLSRSIRSLNKWDILLKKKEPILVAFAVWDGSNSDRNGRKVVSMWQRLHLP